MSDTPRPKPAVSVERPRRRYKLGLWAVLATVVAGGLGYLTVTLWLERRDLTEELGTCTTDRDRYHASANGMTEDLTACTTQRDQDAEKYAAIETDLGRTQADLKASAQELEDLRRQRAEVEKRLEAFRSLTSRLKAMIDSGQLDVVVRKGRMIVELPAEVMFPSGSAELSEAGEMALMRLAITLEQFPDRQFMVAGHTDAVPLKSAQYRNNRELSTARAVTVTQYLIKAGMKPENLVAAGYGEHDPIASNKDPKGRQKNRRIDIVLLPALEELPQLPEELTAAEESPAE
jgi:chemotaxis protein MotB